MRDEDYVRDMNWALSRGIVLVWLCSHKYFLIFNN